MYTQQSPILYPEEPQRLSASPVSTQNGEHFVALEKSAVPLGFCSGGFSSTAGYGPGNEAQSTKQ